MSGFQRRRAERTDALLRLVGLVGLVELAQLPRPSPHPSALLSDDVDHALHLIQRLVFVPCDERHGFGVDRIDRLGEPEEKRVATAAGLRHALL